MQKHHFLQIFDSLVFALNPPLAEIVPPFLQVAIFPLIENSLSDKPQSAYIPDEPPLFIGDPLEPELDPELEPLMGYLIYHTRDDSSLMSHINESQ